MKRQRQELDERQRQDADRVGARSFYMMFFTCVLVIAAEMIWNGNIRQVLGETLVLAAGGAACIAGSIRNGIYTKNRAERTLGQTLFGSVVCAGIFSILYALVLERRVKGESDILKAVGIFFLGITVLCFLCLYLTGLAAKKKREQEEKKYAD